MHMINIEEIKTRIRPLAEQHHLSLVVLFGSQASGKTHAQSDIDIGVLEDGPIELGTFARLSEEFVYALKSRKVELTDLATLPPLLLKNVAMKGVTLYEDEPAAFARFRIYALKRYMEAKPLLRLRDAQLQKFLQSV